MAQYENVLVAIDGSTESQKIIQKALDVVAGTSAKVSVVVVFEDLLNTYTYELNMGDFEKAQKEFQSAYTVQVKAMIDEKFPSIGAEAVHFLHGKAGDEIKKLAKDSGADLIVLGSHGQGAIKSALLGSTANAVLHGSHCDVFTVRV
ncbi:MAG: universal stress protein [Pseudohongiellaceae bacterium]|nr:universal stress protein [Pseudohongiellaceae bacterium]